MWQNSRSQSVSNSESQIETKLKIENAKKLNLKLWQNSTTQIVAKLTLKLKLWQNSKTLIVKKLKTSSCDKTKKNQIKTKLKNSKLKLWEKKLKN